MLRGQECSQEGAWVNGDCSERSKRYLAVLPQYHDCIVQEVVVLMEVPLTEVGQAGEGDRGETQGAEDVSP